MNDRPATTVRLLADSLLVLAVALPARSTSVIPSSPVVTSSQDQAQLGVVQMVGPVIGAPVFGHSNFTGNNDIDGPPCRIPARVTANAAP